MLLVTLICSCLTLGPPLFSLHLTSLLAFMNFLKPFSLSMVMLATDKNDFTHTGTCSPFSFSMLYSMTARALGFCTLGRNCFFFFNLMKRSKKLSWSIFVLFEYNWSKKYLTSLSVKLWPCWQFNFGGRRASLLFLATCFFFLPNFPAALFVSSLCCFLAASLYSPSLQQSNLLNGFKITDHIINSLNLKPLLP